MTATEEAVAEAAAARQQQRCHGGGGGRCGGRGTVTTAVAAATEAVAATKGAGATEGARRQQRGVMLYCSLERRLGLFKSYVASYGYVRRPGTDRIPEGVKKKLRRNRNPDSCGKSATGTEKTGIRRIPAGIGNLDC
jgi:hypothetical protein